LGSSPFLSADDIARASRTTQQCRNHPLDWRIRAATMYGAMLQKGMLSVEKELLCHRSPQNAVRRSLYWRPLL